jgi:hypothetical protein
MKLNHTRAGLIFECVDCGSKFEALSPEADEHECMTVFSF